MTLDQTVNTTRTSVGVSGNKQRWLVFVRSRATFAVSLSAMKINYVGIIRVFFYENVHELESSYCEKAGV